MPLVSFFCVVVQPFYFGWLVVYAQRKIDLGDFPYYCRRFWVAFNMLTFFKGLSLTPAFSDYGVYAHDCTCYQPLS
jgi:hypothetical protein